MENEDAIARKRVDFWMNWVIKRFRGEKAAEV
jgi:hypothetical protein